MQHGNGNGNENLPYRLIIGMTHEFVLKLEKSPNLFTENVSFQTFW